MNSKIGEIVEMDNIKTNRKQNEYAEDHADGGQVPFYDSFFMRGLKCGKISYQIFS
jgi:hypothetical protein